MSLLIVVLIGFTVYALRQVSVLRQRIEALEAQADTWEQKPAVQSANRFDRSVSDRSKVVPEAAAAPEPKRSPEIPLIDYPSRAFMAAVADDERSKETDLTKAVETPEPAEPGPPRPMWRAVGGRSTAPEDVDDAPASFNFEDIFGRRLPIWAGGVTLAIVGVLIVKYSIDTGLLSPLVRVVCGLLFGMVLIAGAEVLFRKAALVADDRVRQALAGAGIATFYATTLIASNLYHLVGPGTAFGAMALVTVLAGSLSLRFGAPSAVLGLIGGLAAPALVGSDQPDIPLLTLYLALTVGGLCALARRQRWWWLGAAALAGGFGWGILLIAGGVLDTAATGAVGLYVLALAVGLPLLIGDERGRFVQLAGALAGCAQMAALVATGGFTPLHWALFGLISAAFVWLSRRQALFAPVPFLGLATGVLLMVAWPNPAALDFGIVLAALTAIYAVPAALRLWRDDRSILDTPVVAVATLAIGILPLAKLVLDLPAWPALVAAGLAAAVAVAGWRVPLRRDDARFATLVLCAAAMLALAGIVGLDRWTVPPVLALLAVGLNLIGRVAEDQRLERGAWLFGGLAVAALPFVPAELERLAGVGAAGPATSLLRWAIPAAAAAFVAARSTGRRTWVLQPLAVVVGYGAAAQAVPGSWLPLVPVALVVAAALLRRPAILPAAAAGIALMLAWSLLPVASWLIAAIVSLDGRLIPLDDLPTLHDVGLRILPAALALGLAGMRLPSPRGMRNAAFVAAGAGALVAVHVLYRQLFGIDDGAAFVARVMAQRTIWEMALAAAALAAWFARSRFAATLLGGAGLAHFLWFTVLVQNPLWVAQDVGPWLVPAYLTAGGLAWAAAYAWPGLDRGRDAALMALTTLLGFSLLRQVAHGTLLLDGGLGAGEDIARSVLAIALAVAFLWVGIARAARDWRVASLALMLVAVGKVFLLDAAGLDGLARIASFAALGFSLIGVGWVYSRYLNSAER